MQFHIKYVNHCMWFTDSNLYHSQAFTWTPVGVTWLFSTKKQSVSCVHRLALQWIFTGTSWFVLNPNFHRNFLIQWFLLNPTFADQRFGLLIGDCTDRNTCGAKESWLTCHQAQTRWSESPLTRAWAQRLASAP